MREQLRHEVSELLKDVTKPDGTAYNIYADGLKIFTTVNYSMQPKLETWVKSDLQPTVEKWYPILIEYMKSLDYSAPDKILIEFTYNYKGVACADGSHILCDPNWFIENINGEATGAIVHELAHVVQHYGYLASGENNPSWLIEGIADYYRWFKFEKNPAGTIPRDLEKASYTDSYRITGGFINYLIKNQKKDIANILNQVMREGKYNPDIWIKLTGNSVSQLWEEYIKSVKDRVTN